MEKIDTNLLENIASKSQKERIIEVFSSFCSLKDYERHLGVKVKDRVQYLRSQFKDEVLLVVDIGCCDGNAMKGLNRFKNVNAFGIDIRPHYDPTSNFSVNRLIVADASDMCIIPDSSFHYLISHNSLKYSDLKKSIPEIFRVLRPEGIADFDIGDLTEKADALQYLYRSNKKVFKSLKLSSTLRNFSAPVDEFCNDLVSRAENKDPSFHPWEVHNYRMEMTKP